jgi:hypothetical protein
MESTYTLLRDPTLAPLDRDMIIVSILMGAVVLIVAVVIMFFLRSRNLRLVVTR